jgi:quinol monooxygenase YgiN
MISPEQEPVQRPYTPEGPLTILVRVQVQNGHQEEFERFITGLSADVARFEEGCLWYAAHRVLGSPDGYMIIMRFRCWEDYETHGDTPHMKGAMPGLDRLLVGPPQFEIYAAVE